MCVCMYVGMFAMYVCTCTQKPEEVVSFYGTVDTGHYEPPDMCAGNQTWLLARAASMLNSGDITISSSSVS